MSVQAPPPPMPVPELEATTSGRSFASGLRAAAVSMSTSASVMRDNAAPASWSGTAAEVAEHAMTGTALDLEALVAALQRGAAAGDAYMDRVESLTRRREALVARRRDLEDRIASFMADAALYDVETEEDALRARSEALRSDVVGYDAAVEAWVRDVSSAEERFVGALASADTAAEAASSAAAAPDVTTLFARLGRLHGDPRGASAWWRSLSRVEREALKVAHPLLVGNTDGIPVADRDEANRAALSSVWNSLEQEVLDGEELSDDEQARVAQMEAIYQSFREAGAVTDYATGEPVSPYLMAYMPTAALGDGVAAMAFGNPETADHVSVNVPGFGSRLDTFDGVAGDALNVFESAQRLGNGSVASIAWMGYNAPDPQLSDALQVIDTSAVAHEGLARAGAERLSGFIDGLRATDSGDTAHLTVIGHSYGSTTVAKASADGLEIDETVLVGSPGAGAGNDHARDLSGDVYVGASDEDFVSRLGNPTVGGLGNDPAATDFGATRFEVRPGEDFNFTKQGFEEGIVNHTSYFDDVYDLEAKGISATEDSASLQQIGHVVAGLGDQVETVPGREQSSAEWVAQETVQAGGIAVQEITDAAREDVQRTGERLQAVGGALVDGGRWVLEHSSPVRPVGVLPWRF